MLAGHVAGAWLDQLEITPISASVKGEVEVEAELGNKIVSYKKENV